MSLSRRLSERIASRGVCAFGELAFVVAAAGTVAVADLGDRRAVQSMVQPTVAAPREPMDGPSAGGELDRGGAGVGGITAGGGEPRRVAAVADEHAGDDRADPEDLRQRRRRRCHRGADPFPVVLSDDVEVFDLDDELDGLAVPLERRHIVGLRYRRAVIVPG